MIKGKKNVVIKVPRCNHGYYGLFGLFANVHFTGLVSAHAGTEGYPWGVYGSGGSETQHRNCTSGRTHSVLAVRVRVANCQVRLE